MSKLVITEINRIQELMGKPLITEQWVDIADDVISFFSKPSEVAGKNAINSEINYLVKKLGTLTNDKDIIEVLSKLIDESEEIAQMVIPKIMSTLSAKEIETITKFKSSLKKAITNNEIKPEMVPKIVDNFIEQKIVSKIDGIKNIIKKDITNYVGIIPKPKPSLITNPKTITDVAGQSWENIKPLSNDEILRLEKLYRQKGLGGSFYKALNAFSQNVTDMMTEQFELMDETLSLIKTSSSTDNAAKKGDLLKRIGENIKTLTQRDTDNFKIIDEWIEMNVSTDYKLKTKIKNLNGYIKAASIFDNSALKKWKETYKSFWTRRGDLLKQANSMINPFSWFPGVMKKKFGESGGYGSQVFNKLKEFIKGPKYAELRRYITLGQTQSWSGINDFRKEFGFLPAIRNVGKEWIWSYVALAGLFGFIDYITDVLGNQLRNTEWINDYGFLKKQIESYDKNIKKEYSDTGIEKSAKGFESFFGDIFIYTTEELKEMTAKFPGLLDDFSSFWFDLRNDDISKENVDKLILKGDDLKQKIGEEMKKIEQPANEIINEIVDSEPGFRLWCQKNEKEFAGYNVDGDGLGRTKKNGVITTWSWKKDTKTFDEY